MQFLWNGALHLHRNIYIQTAVCCHAVAGASNRTGSYNYKLSHQHEKKTYDIYIKQLGDKDSRNLDSQNCLKIFKMHELQIHLVIILSFAVIRLDFWAPLCGAFYQKRPLRS